MIVSNILSLSESYQICLEGLQTMYYPYNRKIALSEMKRNAFTYDQVSLANIKLALRLKKFSGTRAIHK